MVERVMILGDIAPEEGEALTPIDIDLLSLLRERVDVSEEDYLRVFKRKCLFYGAWQPVEAVDRWQEIEGEILHECDILVLVGEGCRRATGLDTFPKLCLRGPIGMIPAPGKYTSFYDNKYNQAAAEILMEELYYRATE